jgi:hypothetical protein
MEQKEIWYKDIKRLGFKIEESPDKVYFDQYGFPYSVVYINLTKHVSIEWEQETRLCRMLNCDKEGNIIGNIPIQDLAHLEQMIEFFKGKEKDINPALIGA